jgi:hypothetical protein
MLPGERRAAGDYLCSPNGRVRFGLSLTGDLELRASDGTTWSAGTCCGDHRLAMQRDGNLVVYDESTQPLFATNTRGNDGAFLAVEDAGRAVLLLNGVVIWSTDD